MKHTRGLVGIAVLTLGVAAIGCPDPEEPPPPELFPVDADTFPDELTDHLRDQQNAHLESTAWVEDTELFDRAELPPVDRPDDEDEDFERLLEFLVEDLFVDEHIEDETDTRVTYLLDGQRVCQGLQTRFDDNPAAIDPAQILRDDVETAGEDLQRFHALEPVSSHDDQNLDDTEPFPDTDCVQQIDAAEIRLNVTSPAPREYHVGVRVGPQRYTPVDGSVAPDITLIDVSVDGVAQSIAHVQEQLEPDAEDDPLDPQQFSGRLQWTFEMIGDWTERRVQILSPIEIDAPDLQASIEAVDPLFARVAEADEQQLETFVNNQGADIELAVGDAEQPPVITMEIPAFATSTRFAAAHGDEWRIFDAGFEQPFTVEVDDQQVFRLQRDTDVQQRYDATIRAAEPSTELSVTPPTEWTLDFEFGDRDEQEEQQDLPEWLTGDTWTIALEQADTPTVGLRDLFALEAVAGTFRWESSFAGETLVVEEGLCLLPGAEDPDPPPPAAPPPEAPQTLEQGGISLHPIHLFQVGPCP